MQGLGGGDMAKGIGAAIAKGIRIGAGADTKGIHDQDEGPAHGATIRSRMTAHG